MRFHFGHGAALLLVIVAISLTHGAPSGERVRRQNMEQLKPWMEWGMKYGGIMGTTVVIPAAQEAASIASAGREGGAEEGQS